MNFHLSLASPPDRVQVVAGINSAQVGLGIDGLFRYISATTSQAVTGPAGAKDIFAVTGPNNLQVNPGGNPPELDNTDYTFSLQVLARGSTPTATSTITNWRKVGELDWDGSKVTGFRVLVGDRDVTALTATAPTPNVVPARVIGATAQAVPLETWESASGQVLASIDPNGRLTAAGFSSPSVWSPGDLKLSMQAADHAQRADGTYDWLLVSAGRLVSGAQYPALRAALGNPPLDGGGNFGLPAINDRALVAAGSTYPAGTVFGQTNVQLSADQLPHHYHSGTTGTDTPDHSHSGTTASENAYHAHSGTTAGDYPDHAHATYIGNLHPSGNAPLILYNPGGLSGHGSYTSPGAGGANWGSGGASARHQHDFGTSNQNAFHQHAFGTGGASARHQHGFSTDGGTSWESGQPLASPYGRNAISLVQPSVAVNVFVKA